MGSMEVIDCRGYEECKGQVHHSNFPIDDITKGCTGEKTRQEGFSISIESPCKFVYEEDCYYRDKYYGEPPHDKPVSSRKKKDHHEPVGEGRLLESRFSHPGWSPYFPTVEHVRGYAYITVFIITEEFPVISEINQQYYRGYDKKYY